MKKIVLLFVFVFSTSLIVAQETTKKDLVKKGNLVAATIYHPNNAVAQQGSYNKLGKLQDTWVSYDTNGNKTAVAQYDNGKKVGTWYFYTNDVLREVKYADNKIAQVTTWKNSETQEVSKLK